MYNYLFGVLNLNLPHCPEGHPAEQQHPLHDSGVPSRACVPVCEIWLLCVSVFVTCELGVMLVLLESLGILSPLHLDASVDSGVVAFPCLLDK